MHVAPAGRPVFVETEAPTDAELQALLHRIIARVMKLLTRFSVLVEEARGAAKMPTRRSPGYSGTGQKNTNPGR